MFYPATKLIIITETFISDDVCKIIDDCGAKGYTLVPAGGKGLHHLHATAEKATVAEDFNNIKIEVVCSERKIAELIAGRILDECFLDYPGVMYLENVEIMRPVRF